jgi:lysozyme
MATTDNDTFDLAQLMDDLQIDEGRELLPYTDTMGKITIGVGRNLTDRGITDAECDAMLADDIALVCGELDKSLSWWRLMPAPRQRVLANLCFNMGLTKLLEFTTFLSLMRTAQFHAAASDLQGTAWYGEVGQRGPRTVARLLSA